MIDQKTYDLMREGRDTYAQMWREAKAECDRYRKALEEIRDTDYRGSRSQESEIAFRALARVNEGRE